MNIYNTIRQYSNKLENINLLLHTDVYKMGHMEQYKPGCTKVYSYLQARSNRYYNESIFFGLQYYLKNYLKANITRSCVDEFINVRKNILGVDTSEEVKEKLYSLADLSYLPVKIKAVPEGTKMPVKNVLLTITNTRPEFYWVVGFIESLLLKLWFPINVATVSHEYRKIVDRYFDKTVDKELDFLREFTVHDFGYRSCSSEESAEISGIGHLISFKGSDTVPAYNACINNYNTHPMDNFMLSVPASEHSVMCSFGREGEFEAYEHMLKTYPEGIVSIVSDTYSIWNVLRNFSVKLKDQILNRNGKVVFRPDSGNPEYIICGDPIANPNSDEGKGCIKILDEIFGSTVNSKGYKVLNEKVGLIYGDGMSLEVYENTLANLEKQGYSACNLVIGVGSLLRNHNRDTMGFAIKATKVEINGVEKSIMKDPITDSGKKSHQGYLCLKKEDGEYITYDNVSKEMEQEGFLETVFEDGVLLKEYSLNDVKNNLYG